MPSARLSASRLLPLFVALAFLAGTAVRADAPDANVAWDAGVADFLDGHFAANPVAAVYAGRHEFDGRLPDLGDAALRGTCSGSRRSAPACSPFDPARLSEDRRRERAYLLAALDVDLFWRKEADWPRRNPAWYLGVLDPGDLPEQAVRAAGAAHARLHRLRPRLPRRRSRSAPTCARRCRRRGSSTASTPSAASRSSSPTT